MAQMRLNWLGRSGIYRDMVGIDIFCGVALLVLAIQSPHPRIRVGLTVVSFGTIEGPNWGRYPFRYRSLDAGPCRSGACEGAKL